MLCGHLEQGGVYFQGLEIRNKVKCRKIVPADRSMDKGSSCIYSRGSHNILS